MASTYTTNTGIELINTGEQSGTWGETTNTNLQIVDRALNGVGSITLSGTTHTLSTTDGTLTDGMFKVLVLGGSPSGTNTITVSPNDAQKIYFVYNNSGQSAIFTQGSGANVTVANGDTKIIYCDGAGAGAAVSDFTANLACLRQYYRRKRYRNYGSCSRGWWNWRKQCGWCSNKLTSRPCRYGGGFGNRTRIGKWQIHFYQKQTQVSALHLPRYLLVHQARRAQSLDCLLQTAPPHRFWLMCNWMQVGVPVVQRTVCIWLKTHRSQLDLRLS
jgi:hypothetical protein